MRNSVVRGVAVMLCAAGVAAAATTATLMSVQVKKADLRNTPSFLGNISASLQYGDRVAIDQQQGAWYRVTKPGTGVNGWLHNSALTKKTIVMKAGDGAQTSASSGEMALAGKGFNADIEKEFKAGHRDIDFSPVDTMISYKVAGGDIQSFIHEGGLKPQGGVQ